MDNELILNGFRYRVIRPLGVPGFIAQAFLAEALDYGESDTQVVVKYPTAGELKGFGKEGQAGSKAQQLAQEAEVIRKLNEAEVPGWNNLPDAKARSLEARRTVPERAIIAGLDLGETQQGQFCIIQEFAPPEVKLTPISDVQVELQFLSLAQRLAQAVSFVHDQNIALKDFYPQTKIDRLRVTWQDGQIENFKLIDWNITADPARSLDMANDVICLEGLVFALLTGRFLPLQEREERYSFPSLDVSAFVGASWMQLSEATRMLLQRLVNPLEALRPASASVVESEVKWLMQLLQYQDRPPMQWVELAHNSRNAPHHVLAIVATAQKKELPPRPKDELAYAARLAEQALEADERRIMRDIEIDLRDGVFSQAKLRIEDALKKLDPNSESARQANYRLQQVRLAVILRKNGVDARRDEGYGRFATAVEALIKKDWPAAQAALQGIAAYPYALEEGLTSSPLEALKAVTEWQLQKDALLVSIADQQVPPDEGTKTFADALSAEGLRLAELNRICEELDHWLSKAPFEVDLQSQLLSLREEIGQRQRFLKDWKSALDKLEAGDEAITVRIGRDRLRVDGQDARARMLVEEAESILNLKQQKPVVEDLMRRGRYKEALAEIENLEAQCPAYLRERIVSRAGLLALRKSIDGSLKQMAEVDRQLTDIQGRLHELRVCAEEFSPTLFPLPDLPEEVASFKEQRAKLDALQRRMGDEVAPVFSEAQRQSVQTLEEDIRKIEALLIKPYLEPRTDLRKNLLEYSLDEFGRQSDEWRSHLADCLEQLQDLCGPEDESVARYYKGLEQLTNLLSGTEKALAGGNTETIVAAFSEIAKSDYVPLDTQEAVRLWTESWWYFQNNPRAKGGVSKNTAVGAVWPGLVEFSQLILKAMKARLIGMANAEYEQKYYANACSLYEKATDYGELSDVDLQRFQFIQRENTEIESDLSYAEPNDPESFVSLWNKYTHSNYRQRIKDTWEERIWEGVFSVVNGDTFRAAGEQFFKAG
ncbi:MAG: hypothetical protein RBS57_15475, partial [Desulforhabdus sp.]|nr:hypothetical protein [Desulforhabdus sp.]